jgi:hypothetical protein
VSSEFVDGLARVQQGIHEAAGWDQSVLLLVRPAAPEAAVVHVDDTGRVWGGATRAPAEIERLRRAAEAIRSDDENDITRLVAEFHAEELADKATVEQLMGSHVQAAGDRSDAAIALLMIRDRDADESLTARFKNSRTVFVAEPLGHTDALLVDAAGYAVEPLLETRGVKGPVTLAPPRPDRPQRTPGPSALTRFLRLELPELVRWIEPFDEWIAEQDAPIQVAAWTWARIADELQRLAEDDGNGAFDELLDALADDQDDYWPRMEGLDPKGNPIPDIVGAILGGIWDDIGREHDDRVPRLEELLNAALNAAMSINRASARWGSPTTHLLGTPRSWASCATTRPNPRPSSA